MGTHCAGVIPAIFILGNGHLGLKTAFYKYCFLVEVIESICAQYHDNEEEQMGDKWRVLPDSPLKLTTRHLKLYKGPLFGPKFFSCQEVISH